MSARGSDNLRGIQSLLYERNTNGSYTNGQTSEGVTDTIRTEVKKYQSTFAEHSSSSIPKSLYEVSYPEAINPTDTVRARKPTHLLGKQPMSDELLHIEESSYQESEIEIELFPEEAEAYSEEVYEEDSYSDDSEDDYEEETIELKAAVELEAETMDTEASSITLKSRSGSSSELLAFLVSYDNSAFGESFELRKGRWVITNRPSDEFDYILINDDSVSSLHAIIRASGHGKIQVLDQLSEFGTGILRKGTSEEEECCGKMVELTHGDVIRFGNKRFLVCIVPEMGK